jgi:hypothetical protein
VKASRRASRPWNCGKGMLDMTQTPSPNAAHNALKVRPD